MKYRVRQVNSKQYIIEAREKIGKYRHIVWKSCDKFGAPTEDKTYGDIYIWGNKEEAIESAKIFANRESGNIVYEVGE